MSIQAVAWVLDYSQSKGSARLVLIAIANHASEENDWCAWPATRTLAREAGVSSPSTVTTALEALEALGELKIVDRGNARNSGRYRVMFMDPCPDSGRSGGREMDAASSPDRTQRPAQTGQNRKEPEGTVKETSEPFGSDFSECWKNYPRKDARKNALRNYQARRREGISRDELERATVNYAASRKGQDPKYTLLGATFYGPNERWRDSLGGEQDPNAGLLPGDPGYNYSKGP